MSEGERRLAAIMFTDIVGYTTLTQANESQAMEVLEQHNRLLRPFFPKFRGREVKAIGDSFLVEFDSALDAVNCAAEIQSYLHDYNASSKDEWKMKLRIGIHLGDVIHRHGDVFGDAVNIASRVEPVADPEGICVTDQIFGQIRNKFSQPLVKLAPRELRNVQFPIDLYKVVMPWEAQPSAGTYYEVAESQRIAVLPFANMSPDPEDEYFADGLTEEVISTLSLVRDFEVISRTSVMHYKKTTKPIKEVSKELSAGTILEGSVRKAGNRLRVTVQMIDASKDRHLWAQSYERSLDDVFAIQSDVARHVAEALRIKILSPEMAIIDKKHTENTAAYILYLKGRYLSNRRGLDDLKKAVEFFEQAIREDPSFASSYLGLADCFMAIRNNFAIDVAVNLEKAKSFLAKAMDLDPTLADAHATTGLLLVAEYRLREGEESYQKAIALKPSHAFAHSWYYTMLIYQLRWAEAVKQIGKALELDPLSPLVNFNHASLYYSKREYDKALELSRRVAELYPDYVNTYWLMAWMYGRMNRFDDMSRNFGTYVELTQSAFPLVRKSVEAWGAYLRNDRETVKRLLPELQAHLEETSLEACEVAGFYIYLDEIDKGFEWLGRSYSNREYGLLQIRLWDFFDKIRSEPRYLELVRRLGLDQAETE